MCVYIYIYIYIYTQLGAYIFGHRHIFLIILATVQNIFMLQLYNECGLKVQTLSFNLRVFSSQLEERLRSYRSLILYVPTPFFKGA